MKKRALYTLFLLLNNIVGLSVHDSNIVFDRPGIAESPYIVVKNQLQIEGGFSYSEFTGTKEIYYPVMLLRKSFMKKNELRISFNYEPQFISLIKQNYLNNLTPIAIGYKFSIFNENGKFPETAILLDVFTPIEQLSKPRLNNMSFDFGLLFQNNLSKNWSINYNIGYLKTFDFKNILSYSHCVNYTISSVISVFGEVFGYYDFEKLNNEIGVDGGFILLLKNNCQLDLSFINNFTNNSSYGFVNIGFSKSFGKHAN